MVEDNNLQELPKNGHKYNRVDKMAGERFDEAVEA